MSFRRTPFGLTTEQQVKRAREYVPRWDTHSPNHFETKLISGGLTNILSTVQLAIPGNVSTYGDADEEEEELAVLFRQNGQGTSELINRKQEERVIEFLSEAGLYPKVYAQLEWGSIQRFLTGHRALTPQEYRSKDFIPIVGKLLGQMHGRRDMVSKASIAPGTGSMLGNRLEGWLELAAKVTFDEFEDDRLDRLKLAALDLPNLRSEVQWLLTELLPPLQSKIVLAHCDLQCGNVMYCEETGECKMIDLEYADRMERGFDLGNCFCEMSLNYCIKGKPGFVLNPDYYPGEDEQDLFLTAYCYGAGLEANMHEEKTKLKCEANAFALVSHLQWSIWGIIMANNSTIDFGYLDYALQRMTQYWAGKQQQVSGK